MKIVKSFEESGFLLKGLTKTTKNEAKQLKSRFLNILLGILGTGSLGNILTDKGVKARIPGRVVMRAGDRTIRAKGTIREDQDFQYCLILWLTLR